MGHPETLTSAWATWPRLKCTTKAEELHEDFRLWITAEPHPQFPIGLLQMSIKLTNGARWHARGFTQPCVGYPGHDGRGPSTVAPAAAHHVLPPFHRSGAQEVRSDQLERPVRVQRLGPRRLRPVPSEPHNRDGHEEAQLPDADGHVHDFLGWYGGRITDGFDELLMDTYAAKYFNQGALTKGIELFPGYKVPTHDVTDFRTDIEALPLAVPRDLRSAPQQRTLRSELWL